MNDRAALANIAIFDVDYGYEAGCVLTPPTPVLLLLFLELSILYYIQR